MLTILLVCLQFECFCQDSVLRKKQWGYSGYIKDLVWLHFDKSFEHAYATNLVHNRINVKWNPSQKISGRIEVRNRFYCGDDVRLMPNFKEQLRNKNEAINLSATWWSNHSVIFHSAVERLWMEYRKSKLSVRAGRQRINWGVTNTWNPNDLFNTYNFLDFDYEERPGSDAVKFQYRIGDLSNIELAWAKTKKNSITAIKYFTNYRKYDLQAIAGIYQNIFTAGAGWAGSISEVGFKGEVQFYADRKDSSSNFTSAVEADYIFKNGWYLSSAILYNQNGLHGPINEEANIVFEASPRNLMPAKWNLLLNSSKEFTPIFNGSISIVYSPQINMVILFPSVRYNLKPNLDLDFVWQSFFAEAKKFQAITHTAFLRLKWSFAK
jgi:hypothetical protein